MDSIAHPAASASAVQAKKSLCDVREAYGHTESPVSEAFTQTALTSETALFLTS